MQLHSNRLTNPIPHLRDGVFLFLILLCSLSILGQEEKQRFKSNLFAGISSSQISGDDLSGFKKLGFTAGIGVRVALSEKWDAAMDITYTSKGSRDLPDFENNDFDSYLLHLDYIEVPFYGHYKQDKWEFDAGLALGYLLRFREEDENGTIMGLGRSFKNIDLGGLLGLSYPLGEKFRLGIRGTQSFLAVRDNAGGTTFRLNRGQYNSVLNFTIRYFPGQ